MYLMRLYPHHILRIVASLGEYAALVTAGILTLEDGLRLVAGRAQLMADKCIPNDTGMLAVKLSPSKLEDLVRTNKNYNELSVACYNRYAYDLVRVYARY